MGALECQAKPSLCDVDHDRVRVHLIIDQPQTWASGVVRQGKRHGPSFTHKIKPCWVTLLQSARRAAVLGRPSSLRPHCHPRPPPPRKQHAVKQPCRKPPDRKRLITPTDQERFPIGGARSEVPEARAQEGARGLTREKRIPQDRQGGQGGHAQQVTAFFLQIIN
jgi:hypothetical protein